MPEEAKDITIYISTHKPTAYIKNGIFKPILVGAELSKHRSGVDDAILDNTGDHISAQNPRFCELTAQYWAWKNDKSKHVGFFHYRRYLSFHEEDLATPDAWGNIVEDYLDSDLASRYLWDDADIRKTVETYDIILPNKKDILNMPNMKQNMRDQYSSEALHAKDLTIMLEVLKEKYPEYIPYAEKFLQGHEAYLNNMFIMKKDIFNKYSEWLFDILFECDKRIDYSDYSIEALRTPGHLAERLLNIYLLHLIENGSYKIKELPTIIFLDTEPVINPKPAFSKNNIAITLAANEFYSPYLATVLASIRENSASVNNYDIIIMHKDISTRTQNKLAQVLENVNNFSLRFLNIKPFEKQMRGLFLRDHFTIETWFRLLMPEVLTNYDKVLYLDADLIVNADIAALYNTKIDDYLLAACHDADSVGLYCGILPNKKHYIDEILKLKNPYDYFQAGVLLLNLKKLRKEFSTNELLSFAASYDWELLDQDVLNYFAQGQVYFLDTAWNVMYDWRYIRIDRLKNKIPKYLYDDYVAAHQHPKIIHYAGPDKPWNDPSVDYAELFWKYCRQSGYYETVILRMCSAHNGAIANRADASHPSLIKRVAHKALPEGTKRGQLARTVYKKLRR